MKTVYAVQTIPVREVGGALMGWVRVDLVADGTKPTDVVYLRDGRAYGQAEALRLVTRDPGLLFPTRAEAARDGLARLREADRELDRARS